MPELSFGTHFFLDLVEAEIRYLPLYPDDDDTTFNEPYLLDSPNILADVLPEYGSLADTIRLIDIAESDDGLAMQVLMNGDRDEAVGFLAEIDTHTQGPRASQPQIVVPQSEDFWSWRLQMAESIAAQLDAKRFGVQAFYVFGSVKNANAGPCSDIDLLVHFRGTKKRREALLLWAEGWSRCLDEMNYLRTGHRTGGLLDLHIVTDEDIANKTSFAVKIGAVTDAARPLPLGSQTR